MAESAEKDYYSILGVSPSASDEEIKHAYRTLARRYHPDSRTEQAPTTLFHEIQAAYTILGDRVSRAAYDARRAEGGISEKSLFSLTIHMSQEHFATLPEEQLFYLMIEIRPGGGAKGERLPLNLCLAIDRSTSMQGARLEHVKQAASQIIEELLADDALAVVVFNDRAEVILPSTANVNRTQAKSKVASIFASGGTEILQGIQAGLQELDKRHSKNVTSHLILLTDGQTYGDEEACLAEARMAGARRIGITAMGIGEDWNDALLDEIASQTGGVSAYIASPGQVRSLLQKQVRGLGSVFAQGLTLGFRCAEGARVESLYRVSPYIEKLTLTEQWAKLGSLQADSPTVVVAEVVVAPRPPGTHRLLQVEVMGDVPSLGRTGERVRRDIAATFTSEAPSPPSVSPTLLSVLSKITIYRMQEKAWDTLERGDVQGATHQLERVATRLFDLGETQLARAAMLEAGRLAQSGLATSRGRKEIKYGTKSLSVPRP